MNRNKKYGKNKSTLLTKEKVEEISRRMYDNGMKHVDKFNKYEQERKNKQKDGEIKEECTFKPNKFTQKYHNQYKNISTHRKGQTVENRLLQWEQKRNKKIRKKTVEKSVEEQTKSVKSYSSSISKISTLSSKAVIQKLFQTSGSKIYHHSKKPSFGKSTTFVHMKEENVH